MTLYAALSAFAALAFLCQVHCFLFDFVMSLNYSAMTEYLIIDQTNHQEQMCTRLWNPVHNHYRPNCSGLIKL